LLAPFSLLAPLAELRQSPTSELSTEHFDIEISAVAACRRHHPAGTPAGTLNRLAMKLGM